MKHKNGIENVILQLQKRNKNGNIHFCNYYQSHYETQEYVSQCLQLVKIAFRQCKHGCKNRRKKTREKRKWKDDRMLIKSNHTYLKLDLLWSWMDRRKMVLTGELWLHPTTLVHAEFVVLMNQGQRVVVVCGSGQILNSIWEEILEYSQRLLDALGNQGWNTMAIKNMVNQMSEMIEKVFGLVDLCGWVERAHWKW
jgi:hypothetical protein